MGGGACFAASFLAGPPSLHCHSQKSWACFLTAAASAAFAPAAAPCTAALAIPAGPIARSLAIEVAACASDSASCLAIEASCLARISSLAGENHLLATRPLP